MRLAKSLKLDTPSPFFYYELLLSLIARLKFGGYGVKSRLVIQNLNRHAEFLTRISRMVERSGLLEKKDLQMFCGC